MLHKILLSLAAITPATPSPLWPPILQPSPPATRNHTAEPSATGGQGTTFLFRGRKKGTILIEIPQQVQYDGLYAPEVGRIRPGDRRPGLTFKPEMDNDPREPWLEPAEPVVIETQDNGFMNSQEPM